jgi:protein arginine N-methyltransferase 1
LYKTPKHKINFDNAKDHDYYFNSYSSHHIHEEMLKDSSRTLSYQKAIEGNPEDFKDKIVLDIGCGTGILSLFAARAGAKHVYAVDNAEIALFAKDIVKKNGFEDKITVYKGKMEEIEFPFKEGEVDIIISEWMGYFLLYESMLDCVLWARDKYLKKGTGKMLPDRAQLYVAAIEDSDYTNEKKTFWNDVYGFDMSVMSTSVFKDPVVDTVPAAQIMSDYCCILDIDLVNMKADEVNFSSYYSLKMNYTDKVHALVAWFDTTFGELTRPVVLTTSPMKKYTHWKQSVLYLDKPLDVRKGDTLYGSIATR